MKNFIQKLICLVFISKKVFTSKSIFFVSRNQKNENTNSVVFGLNSDIVISLANEMIVFPEMKELVVDSVNAYNIIGEKSDGKK
jgi:hypothetical protein